MQLPAAGLAQVADDAGDLLRELPRVRQDEQLRRLVLRADAREAPDRVPALCVRITFSYLFHRRSLRCADAAVFENKYFARRTFLFEC